jgi:hypothetical protein
MRRPQLAVLALTLAACVTPGTPKPDIEELKPTIEAFHRMARWKDFRGAADLLVPSKRTAFIKARSVSNDDRDLYITDYQLEDARLEDGMTWVEVISKMSWYRMPNTTETTRTITSVFRWKNGKWWLESQDDGPFPELKPEVKPKATPGAPDAGS